jgi:hypothetical protein
MHLVFSKTCSKAKAKIEIRRREFFEVVKGARGRWSLVKTPTGLGVFQYYLGQGLG